MTFPLFCSLHLAYGVAMAFATRLRMRSEGEVLGIPLVATLLPVGIVSAPVGAVLLRYAGFWFLHGAFSGDGNIAYERFHLGLMMGVGVCAGLFTVVGMFFAIACITRDKPRLALLPVAGAFIFCVTVIAANPAAVMEVAGTGGRMAWAHPVGLISLANVAALVAAWMFARARLAMPVRVT